MADTNSKRDKPPGRPSGSKNARDIVATHPSRCKRCKSTQRTRYTRTTTRRMLGKTAAGDPFNVIHWKRTTCKKCGQARVDQVFELVDT